MSRQIFINLPVADLERSKAFYAAVGATPEPRFSDASGACMKLSDDICLMLLTHEKWRGFTSKSIVDAHRAAQAFLCFTVDSKAEVIATLERAVAAGGKPDPSPVDDYEFMYGRSFEDPDGHMWGVNWLNLPAPTP